MWDNDALDETKREAIMQHRHDITRCEVIGEVTEHLHGRDERYVEVKCPKCGFKTKYQAGTCDYFSCDGITGACETNEVSDVEVLLRGKKRA